MAQNFAKIEHLFVAFPFGSFLLLSQRNSGGVWCFDYLTYFEIPPNNGPFVLVLIVTCLQQLNRAPVNMRLVIPTLLTCFPVHRT